MVEVEVVFLETHLHLLFMSTQKLASECRLCLLLRSFKMDGYDPIAIYIICDSSDVVFRVPIALVIALTLIIVRRKPKARGCQDRTHREMSLLVFGGKGCVLFSITSLRAGP